MLIAKIRYFFRFLQVIFYNWKYLYLLKKKGEETAKKYMWTIAKKHINDALKIVNAKVTIEGKENIVDSANLMVGNHQSLFDPLYLIAGMEKNVMPIAKKELEKLPVISTAMKNLDLLFIDRDNAREGLKIINQAAEFLKEGKNILIFPEGTRSKDGEVHEFKKGSFKAAQKADSYIQPFVIEHSSLYNGELESIKLNQDVLIRFLKPFKFSDLSKDEIKNIDEYTKNIIETELKKIRQ